MDVVVKGLKNTSFPLKKGDVKSYQVKTLQKWLNDKGYASLKLTEDGDFGNLTQTAVITMQENPSQADISQYFANMIYLDEVVNKNNPIKAFQKGIISADFYHYFTHLSILRQMWI